MASRYSLEVQANLAKMEGAERGQLNLSSERATVRKRQLNSHSESREHAFTISNNHYADGVFLQHTRPEVLLCVLSMNLCKS
jgi:hypothetical protein